MWKPRTVSWVREVSDSGSGLSLPLVRGVFDGRFSLLHRA
jgi:hypothetical protein